MEISGKRLAIAAGLALGTGACVAAAAVYTSRNRKTVKSYIPYTPTDPLPEHSGFDCTRDRFSTRKIPDHIDVIVVGSGIGGLYCAALLAKAGHKVLVLEQNEVVGGCTHSFEVDGWEFDTGMHSVGDIGKYGRLLDLASEGPLVRWAKIGTDGDGFAYDDVKIGDRPVFKRRAGRGVFIHDLVSMFPHEVDGVREYVRLVEECHRESKIHWCGKLYPHWVERIHEWVRGRRFQELAYRPVSEVLDDLFTDPHLKAVLLSQSGCYGLPPDQASFYIHAATVMHFMEGAYYPINGPQSISRALIPTIRRAGGRVLVNAPVKRILKDPSGRACGVELEDRECTHMFAPVIISAAGACATDRMMDAAVVLGPLSRTLLGGVSHIYAFIGIDGAPKRLKLPRCNQWVLPSDDITGDWNRYHQSPPDSADGRPALLITFPASKDPSYSRRHPNKSSCIMIAEALPQWFDEYEDTQTGSRPKVYETMKLRLKNKFLEQLYQLYPQLDGRVRYCEIATPLTNMMHFRRAASFGLRHTPRRYNAEHGLRPQTEVPGLWITGQDVATSGFAGAMLGGLLTAQSVLGYGVFELCVCGRNIIRDLEQVCVESS